MTKQTDRELSIYDAILEEMNPDLIYPSGRQNTDVRDLARQMMRIVEGHHFGTVGYLGLVTLHYATGTLLAHAGPEWANEYIQCQIRMLEIQSKQLVKASDSPTAH